MDAERLRICWPVWRAVKTHDLKNLIFVTASFQLSEVGSRPRPPESVVGRAFLDGPRHMNNHSHSRMAERMGSHDTRENTSISFWHVF